MEKKQLISVVKPLIAAALLFGSSGGVAWGQVEIGGPSGIGNIYGAGESTTIGGGTLHIYASGAPGGTIGSANYVIRSYNAGGSYQDYTNVWTGHWSTTSGSTCNYPNWNDGGITWSGPTAQTGSYYTDPCNSLHGHSHPTGGVTDIFTANQWWSQHNTDDAVALIQTAGTAVNDDASWGTRGVPKTSGNSLVDYKRPTTIAISGNANLTDILIKDLRWYYRTYTLSQQHE